MLRVSSEDRKEAGHCHQRSLLLHDGPPEVGTAGAVGNGTASDQDHESEGSKSEKNESEENESEENGSEESDSDDVSEAGTVVEAEPAGRDNRAHNTLELMTPAATSVSGSAAGAETPQAFGRSEAPSLSTTAAQLRRISAMINEPTGSLFGESDLASPSLASLL